ncbi:MAG: hypothetical protein WDN23_18480 [Edaphobacter sp.]
MRHRTKYFAWLAFSSFSILLLRAQIDSTPTTEFPRFRLIQGKMDSDNLPISGAKLCLLKPENNCYSMPSNAGYSSSSVVYHYGLNPRSERLSLTGGGSLVFFSARFSGGGSGTLDSLAILQYESDGKIVNLLPFVGLTNQSDRALWNIREASSFPILVTADFNWMEEEAHFAKHFYTVNVYHFDAQSHRYAKVFSYRTSKQYPGLDDADRVNVLKPEKAEILRRLGTPY